MYAYEEIKSENEKSMICFFFFFYIIENYIVKVNLF